MNNSSVRHTVEVNPCEFETISDRLIESCDGNVEHASFFHCLGKALQPMNCKIDSQYLKANLTDIEGQ